MLCEHARRALPGSGTDDEAQLGEHTRGCAECAQLEEAYAADAAALEAYAAERELPPIMAGFSDALMRRLAEEPVAVEPEGKVLRPRFNVTLYAALAAALILSVSLGLVLSSPSPSRAPEFATTPTPDPDTQPLISTPRADAGGGGDALPAPRRHERAPTPLRVRNPRGIVPVEGNSGELGRGNLLGVLRDLQRVFPNWDPSGMDRRVPRLQPGEREVRF
jgi:hypothetical protein